MIHFIRNIKVGNKLIFLFILLLVPTVILITDVTITKLNERKELRDINLEEIKLISDVILEFQDERALTYGYLSSKRDTFRDSLNIQRQSTNEALENLENFLKENDLQLSELQLFSSLYNYRDKINELKSDFIEFEAFYQEVREGFLSHLSEEANQIDDQQLRDQLQAMVHLIYAREYLGQLRTLSNRILIDDTISIQDYDLLGDLKTLFRQHERSFIDFASDDLTNFYHSEVNDSSYHDINNLLSELDQNPEGNISELDDIEWYGKFSESIGDLKKVEYHSFISLNQLLRDKLQNNKTELLMYFLMVIATTSLAIWFSVVVIRYIISSVSQLRQVSQDVSRGIVHVEIPGTGKDEFGILAESFRKVVSRNIELATLAHEIGKGNYDLDLNVENENDILGNALMKMKNNLKDLSVEHDRRNWLLSGMSKLNDIMGGVGDMDILSKRVIDFICEYVDAPVGALFIHNSRSVFHLAAGYGFSSNGKENFSFKPGEGLAGEAVLKKKSRIVSDVSESNFKIKTGLSESEYYQLFISPAVFDNEVTGLIELASSKEFTDLDQQFINEAAERIAIAIKTLKTNIETQELLQETQSQAEELENQQDELKQVNTQLNQQRDELEASEEELRASQKDLEEKNAELEEKTNELEEQYEILSVKNQEIEEARQAIALKVEQVEAVSRYKTEFLANMSHELRTPLNSIMILSQILMEHAIQNDRQKDAEHAEIIHNSGNDLLKLINEILDLSRVESGQINLDIREISVHSLKSPKEFIHQAKEKDIEYKQQIDENAPDLILTDSFRLEQIIRNLLSNAFKFTPEHGKIEFSVFRETKNVEYLREKLRNSPEVIAFSVKDSGIGIPKEKQDIVFQAFMQADASTTRKYGGTGLGLSICRELAQLLGGEIHLESTPGKGSTFTLYLPVNPRGKLEENNDPEMMESSLHRKFQPQPLKEASVFKKKRKDERVTVMIIEDDKGFSNLLADFAKNKNFRVVQAFTGKEGLEQLHQSPPEAILLDIKLPDMTGWDILRNLEKNNLLRRIQVHLMTAYDFQNEFKGNSLFNNYLQKPLTLENVSKAFSKIKNYKGTINSVLIVEDNKIENHAIAELLAGHEISSLSAFSGNEALEMTIKEKPDGIILDLMLPDMDGFEVMEAIRKKDPDIPIIIYSGKDISVQEERKLKKYTNTIIIKNENSYLRLMDEVKLFLHHIDKSLSGKKNFAIDLHVPDEVLKKKKVLMVDDDIRNIYSLYSVLEKEGMDITVANDGKEAIEKLKEMKNPDIILMDIMMPEMDGIEAIRKIRQMQLHKDVPIIALTAKAMMEDREKCIQAGASDYISKPVDVDKLVSLMRIWVYDKKMSDVGNL